MASLTCSVYRGRRDEAVYLYVAPPGDFDRVPEALMARLGEPVHVMDLDLHPGRRLARVDAAVLLEALQEHGYYLQLPPTEHNLLNNGPRG